MQTYPGLEINTSIATVGYYGGTSPGDVLVSAQHATLIRYYGKSQTTNCFQLHILLQNTSSTTALVVSEWMVDYKTGVCLLQWTF